MWTNISGLGALIDQEALAAILVPRLEEEVRKALGHWFLTHPKTAAKLIAEALMDPQVQQGLRVTTRKQKKRRS